MKLFAKKLRLRAQDYWIRKVLFRANRRKTNDAELLKKFARRYQLAQSIYSALPVKVDFDQGVLRLSDTDQVIYVARPSRILKYKRGIKFRLNQIFEEYLLGEVPFTQGDLIVDIGANIGEFSLALQIRYNLKVIAIEPDPTEFCALKRNLTGNAELWPCLVWKENTIFDFFLANETGDSSALPADRNLPTLQMQATTLDSIIGKSKFANEAKRIRLLKVEAEGAEPEVLEGALDVLSVIDYISVDCGPERGPGKEATLVPVLALLQKHGFEPICFGVSRTVMLFRNVDCINTF